MFRIRTSVPRSSRFETRRRSQRCRNGRAHGALPAVDLPARGVLALRNLPWPFLVSLFPLRVYQLPNRGKKDFVAATAQGFANEFPVFTIAVNVCGIPKTDTQL